MTRQDQTRADDDGGARQSPWRVLLDAWRRQGERRRLMALDDRMLKDIGLRRADAYREYSKPCWRP